MVNARLHIICGNCGCNDRWEWEYVPDQTEDEDDPQPAKVYLSCRNCATLHNLNDNAEMRDGSRRDASSG